MNNFSIYESELKKHKYLELICSSLLTITCILLLFLPCFKIVGEINYENKYREISVSLFNDLLLAIKLFDKNLFGLYEVAAGNTLFYYSTLITVIVKFVAVVVAFTLLAIEMGKLIKKIIENVYEINYYQYLKEDISPKKNLLGIVALILFCLFIFYIYRPLIGSELNDGYFQAFTGQMAGKCVDYSNWINGLDYGAWVVIIFSLITLLIAIFTKRHGAEIKKKINTDLYLDKINKQKENIEDDM